MAQGPTGGRPGAPAPTIAHYPVSPCKPIISVLPSCVSSPLTREAFGLPSRCSC